MVRPEVILLSMVSPTDLEVSTTLLSVLHGIVFMFPSMVSPRDLEVFTTLLSVLHGNRLGYVYT